MQQHDFQSLIGGNGVSDIVQHNMTAPLDQSFTGTSSADDMINIPVGLQSSTHTHAILGEMLAPKPPAIRSVSKKRKLQLDPSDSEAQQS